MISKRLRSAFTVASAMKSSKVVSGCAGAAVLLAAASVQAAGPVTASYYGSGDWTDTGSSITFSGTPFQVDQISGIDNYANTGNSPIEAVTNTDPNFPSPNTYFGGDFTGEISVPTTGDYTFTMATDDTGYLFVDGSLIDSEPGYHTPYDSSVTINLTAGDHSLELQMDNGGGPCCTAAIVDLPTGVSYVGSGVPEPASWALMLVGFGGLAGALRARRRTAAALA